MTGAGAPGGPLLAVVLCVGAVLCLTRGRDGPDRARLLLAASAATPASGLALAGDRTRRGRSGLLRGLPGGGRLPRWARRAGPGPHWWCLPAGAALALLAESVLPVVAGLAAVPAAGRWLRARREAARVRRRETAVMELCAAVAGELRAGRLPAAALLAGGTEALGPEGAGVAAAARYGGDIPEALRRASLTPGAEGLRGAAACWQVATDGGAGLAEGLDRVARALRADREQHEELRTQLAGPRSTAALLALLPAFGLLLGGAMGARPLQVLFHTAPGLGCLVLGGLLEWAGLAWVARLVRTAEDGGAA
ncbi:type II secretion system F family protein [Streptomyces sp. JJ36]|uniref:type II secretion system F family protein n=1 Tax=Streptomyces sp. JJ36 TaxID=2736645 RepID=UPI001F1CCD8B|nr:type II secretion system F family protein [Streptomyces sp. JJ36]MCF6522577.1 type II secretion system F family protein [Streptomyces sp. JJ36]